MLLWQELVGITQPSCDTGLVEDALLLCVWQVVQGRPINVDVAEERPAHGHGERGLICRGGSF